MLITPEVWERQRDGEPFAQRFVGRFEDGRRTIVGRWEKATDGTTFELDFALTYTKLGPQQMDGLVGSKRGSAERP